MNNPVQPIVRTPAQEAQRRAFLKMLSCYLPYGITVEHKLFGRGLLVGLPYNHALDQPFAQVHFEVPVPNDVCSGVRDVADVKPCLYPFAVLGKAALSFRHNEASHTLLMELAAGLHGGAVTEIIEGGCWEDAASTTARIWFDYEADGESYKADVWSTGAASLDNEPEQMADWLRERHYACALDPSQYIPL